MVNKVILIGNIGKDPEIRSMQNGKRVASLVLATSENWLDQSGERKEKTEWHRLSIFAEGLVNIVEKYVKKGAKLYIEGSIHTRKWTDNSGAERYSTEIILQGFNSVLKILDSRNGTVTSSENSNDYNFTNKSQTKNEYIEDELDDEIPF